MFRKILPIAAVLAFLVPAIVQAQGLLIVVDPDQEVRLPRPVVIHHHHHPHPPIHPIPRPIPRPIPQPESRYKIKDLEVNARLVDQVAQVQVSQSFVNTGSRQMEVSFVFPLPYDGAIEQMTLLVDGKEYPAKLLEADEARKMYEAIVRKNKDPALLEWMGTGMFKTSVFPVPAGAKRTVTLRYSQLCRKSQGLTDFLFPLSTAKYTSDAVENVNVRVTIESNDDIKNVYSPTHEIKIKRPDDRHATLTYESKNTVPTSDFRVLYDVGAGTVSTRVLSYRPDKDEDGYFLLLASPKIKAGKEKPTQKTVMFVVDRSGSMSGKKIEQARGALKFVLNNLREGDLFNIIAYDSQIETFRPELQKYNDETRKAALGFVEGVYAGGSTNIDGALRSALGQLQDGDRPSYVLFTTDGLPTAGETNEMKIVEAAKKANEVRARMFTFGVGYDVNSRLLDRLVRDNFGQGEYVRPDENIEDRVSRLFNRINSPVLTDVQLAFDLDEVKTEHGKPVNRLYPSGSFDLFAGEQLVIVGRYKKGGTAKVVVSGTVGGKKRKFDFPATLTDKSKDETFAFIEKLWAVRRIGEIIDELDLNGKNTELIEELVKLSTQHGILTPYTSFMADENANLNDVAANAVTAGRRLEALDREGGFGGFAQRAMKGRLKSAQQVAPSAPALADSFDASAPRGSASGTIAPADQPAFAGEVAEEAKKADLNVQNVGNRTFYRREGRWVDSKATETQQTNAKRVKQFSDEYFALAQRYGKRMSQYMVFDEPVLLTLDDQAYLIEP